MGGSVSSEIPGGGTEGYHVLRVRRFLLCLMIFTFLKPVLFSISVSYCNQVEVMCRL